MGTGRGGRNKDFLLDGRSFAMAIGNQDTIGEKEMEQEKVEASLFFGGTMKEDAASWRRSQGSDALRPFLKLDHVVREGVFVTPAANTIHGFMDSPSYVNAAGF